MNGTVARDLLAAPIPGKLALLEMLIGYCAPCPPHVSPSWGSIDVDGA